MFKNDLEIKEKDIYRVYINGKFVSEVKTEDEAWKVIGKSTFGSCYEVRDSKGYYYEEFIPY